MAYRFRFESVLGYRRNLEELARQKLALAQAQLERQQSRLAEITAELAQAITLFEERKRQPIPAPLYIMFVDGIERRERDLDRQRQALSSQRQVVEQVRQELVGRMRERKIMEKARERDYEEYLREELKKEQAELDEQMILRFGRHGGR
ncbi:flagellar export protein FliJ [Desulfurivibrio sp. D14AmB]|uniref:flagellar export protein FliJ n=1 Tax=Desulfurivibrio sp. D14AmB TaxID=3374370 RepID=UPI00376F39A1